MQHYVLGDVITEISERENNPSNSEYERFVGLEHYVSGEVEIENYGSTANLNSAMKVFNSGDILVARRNVYLKRASVVYFDGLTSGDSIVLRPKNETIGRILPFILNTDDFWDYADQYSDGTMSKRLSPKVLKQYEFDLPDDNLEQLADILWAMVDVKKSYQRLLKQTDELVKSQFIEMFGNVNDNPKKLPLKTLSDVADINLGLTHTPKYVDEGRPFLSVKNISGGKIEFDGCQFISEEEFNSLPNGARPQAGDVLFCRVGTIGKPSIITEDMPEFGTFVSLGYLRTKGEVTNVYLKAWMDNDEFMDQVAVNAVGSSQVNLNTGWLKNFKILVPPMEDQVLLAEFLYQSDKSKFELKQAIEGVDILIKSMIQQELN